MRRREHADALPRSRCEATKQKLWQPKWLPHQQPHARSRSCHKHSRNKQSEQDGFARTLTRNQRRSDYREVAKNFDAKPQHLYFQVTLPAIAPALMDGLRISVGLALLGAISVEFLVADNGLGHLIWNSWQLLSLKQSMAGLVVAAVLASSRTRR